MPINCLICQQDNAQDYFEKNNDVFYRCGNCGFIFLDKQVRPEKIYNEYYFSSSNSNRCGYADYLNERQNLLRTFEFKIKEILKIKNDVKSVLDVGCASGEFIEVFKKLGATVQGLDVCEFILSKAAKNIDQKNLRLGDISQVTLTPKSFDLVSCYQTIEHVNRPEIALKNMYSTLKDDGLLVLELPNIGSIVAKILGRHWWLYKADHLWHFDRQNIKKLLERCGFEIIKITARRSGKFVSTDFIHEKVKQRRIFKYLKNINKNFYLTSFDVMTVYAKKK